MAQKLQNKILERKLKLTAERKFNIEKVTEINVSEEEGCGVCQKCYRSAEKVIKSEREIKELKVKIKESAKTVANTLLFNLPSPKRKYNKTNVEKSSCTPTNEKNC